MAWIESHTVLSRHRKVKETARALRIRPAYLIGHLHLLWHAALEQAEDGDLTRWTDEFIAESADYPGDAPQFVQLLRDHGWLDGRLLHDWTDYAGKYLIGKYAKDNRDRLVEIWAKHGKKYGKKDPNQLPTDSQLNPNQTPRTPLGKVGEVPGSSLGMGSAEGKPNPLPVDSPPLKLPTRSEEAVGLAAQARLSQPATQADYDRALRVLTLYPSRSHSGRVVVKTMADQNLLARKIADNRDYPWEEHAQLEAQNANPTDAKNWTAPDPVALATLRRAMAEPEPTKPGERPAKKAKALT